MSDRLAQSTIWAYCLPVFGTGFLEIIFTIYLLKYSTDVLFIAPAAMGLIFGIGRIWDALSDPVAGYLSDRSRAARGRRRSWIFASALPILAGVVMVWSPPAFVGDAWLVLWMGVAVLLKETAFTAFYVPHGALGMELSSNYHERTRLFGYKHVIMAAGSGLGVGGVYLLRTADDPRAMAFWLALVGGAVVATLILTCVMRLPERAEHQGRGGVGVYRAFSDVFRNRHGRLLLFVYAIETFGGASLGMLAPYVMQYVVGRPEGLEAFVACYFVPQFVLTPMWIGLSRRFGKKPLWLLAMLSQTGGFLTIFFLASGSFWLVLLVVSLLGLGGGCANVVAPSIQADVIDYDEYLTGERKEGAYYSIWNFIRKAAGGVTAMVTGFVLQAVGFVPNAVQSEETQLAILALVGLLPATCYAIGAVAFARFQLNELEHADVVGRLRERASGARPPG